MKTFYVEWVLADHFDRPALPKIDSQSGDSRLGRHVDSDPDQDCISFLWPIHDMWLFWPGSPLIVSDKN